MTWILLAAGVILFAAITYMRFLMRRTGCTLSTTDLVLTVPDLPREAETLRIAFLSDLHVGALHVPVDHLVSEVDAAQPDLLLLGGDYIAGPDYSDDALRIVSRLSEGRPAFGVLGNADHHQGLDARALRDTLTESGGGLLVNQVGRVTAGGLSIEILGVDEPRHGRPDVEATLAAASDDADVRIGLSHSPALWRELAILEAEIVLFGHTHGGQVRLLGLEAHFTHMNYPRQLAAGLFRYEEGAERPHRLSSHWELIRRREPLRVRTADGHLLYVTRGVGMGFLPLRLSCPPEMLLIEVRRDDDRRGGESDER